MQKVTPFLWFDGQAEEAANHYAGIFDNCKITDVQRQGPEGSVLTVSFEIDGQPFVALNGGPDYKFTEAVSFLVDCHSQEEVDRLWDRLCEGGEPGHCGWLKDKFGVSWQIVPSVLGELMGDPDPEKSARVVKAMLGMGKLDIQGLRDAHQGPDA